MSMPLPEEIYLQYYKKVRSYIGGKVNSPEDAEDLCAEVFLKVFEKLAKYDPAKASVSTWIYTIMHNTVIDYYRTRRSYAALEEDSAVTEGPENGFINEETLRLLAAGLKRLPEQQREIIILRYYCGHTLQDISAMMDLSYGAVKLRHSDALRALRRVLSA